MHVKRTEHLNDASPWIELVFLTDDWRGQVIFEVRYQGPGLWLNLTKLSAPFLMLGGDMGQLEQAIDKAYGDLVQHKADQDRAKRETK